MSAAAEINAITHILCGIEDGKIHSAQAYNGLKDLDPVMIYFVFRYLREKYPASSPASTGVLSRLVELTSTYADLVKAAQAGERDIMKEWFDENHSVGDYYNEPEAYIQLIYDKLEG